MGSKGLRPGCQGGCLPSGGPGANPLAASASLGELPVFHGSQPCPMMAAAFTPTSASLGPLAPVTPWNPPRQPRSPPLTTSANSPSPRKTVYSWLHSPGHGHVWGPFSCLPETAWKPSTICVFSWLFIVSFQSPNMCCGCSVFPYHGSCRLHTSLPCPALFTFLPEASLS